jgi:hypothetical protein
MITANKNIPDMKLKNYIRTVLINIMAAVFPVWLSAQGVYLTPGSNMIMNGSVKLVLNNAGLITDGGFKQGNSTIVFTGSGPTAQSQLGGNNTAAFKHVTINRSLNDVLLINDIFIEGTLTMIKGNLRLNGAKVDLGSTGNISGESNSSHITAINGGVIRKTAILKAPQAVNPGNIGVELTSAANLGQTVIERGHLQQPMPGVGLSIQRYFTIMPTNNVAVNGKLRFYYLDSELAGVNENTLALWSGIDGQEDSEWVLNGKDSSDTVNNIVVKNGLTNFNTFTLAPETTNQLLRVSNTVIPKPVASTAQTSAQAYPNPLQEQFVIALVSNQEKEYVISLYNQYGQLLQSKKPLCRPGMNHIVWDMSHYAKGVYLVVFENDGLKSIKVIKQ